MDLGSWARFEPTLAAFLDGPARPDGEKTCIRETPRRASSGRRPSPTQ